MSHSLGGHTVLLACPALQEDDELQSSSWQHWALCDGHTPVLPPEIGHPDPWDRAMTPRGSAPDLGGPGDPSLLSMGPCLEPGVIFGRPEPSSPATSGCRQDLPWRSSSRCGSPPSPHPAGGSGRGCRSPAPPDRTEREIFFGSISGGFAILVGADSARRN